MPDPHEEARRAMDALLAQSGPASLADPDRFRLDGARLDPGWIVETLAPLLTEARRARIDAVVAARTYGIATVVEGSVNTGNVSAVMRTAEGLGLGAFHVVLSQARFKQSTRTTQGADKWLDVWRWPSAEACADHLHARGYRIVVTHLEAAVPISEIDFSQKTALVFGNEQRGVSPAMLARADARVVLPMEGFVESFNISVAAAIGLYHAYTDRLARLGRPGDLSGEEQSALRAAFYLRSVRHAERVLRDARRAS